MTVGLTWPASVLVFEGSCLCHNPGQHLGQGGSQQTSLQPPGPPIDLLLLSNSLGEGGVLFPEGASGGGPLFWQSPWCYFCSHHLKWNSNQSGIMAGFSKLHAWSFHFGVNDQPILGWSTDWEMVENLGQIHAYFGVGR